MDKTGADREELHNMLEYGVAPDSEQTIVDSEYLESGDYDFEIHGVDDLDSHTEDDIPEELR